MITGSLSVGDRIVCNLPARNATQGAQSRIWEVLEINAWGESMPFTDADDDDPKANATAKIMHDDWCVTDTIPLSQIRQNFDREART